MNGPQTTALVNFVMALCDSTAEHQHLNILGTGKMLCGQLGAPEAIEKLNELYEAVEQAGELAVEGDNEPPTKPDEVFENTNPAGKLDEGLSNNGSVE